MKKNIVLGILLSLGAVLSNTAMEQPVRLRPIRRPVAAQDITGLARYNNTKAVKFYIQGGLVDVNKRDANGKTALDYAIENNNLEMIDALIEAGATIEKEKLK